MAHQYLGTTVGNVQNAYSFKKVVSGYAGNCIKVRRSSDSATSDIGFSGDELDTAALNTFLGGANGFIETWYDQAGSSDLIQTTAANQLRLYTNSDGYYYLQDPSSNAAHKLATSVHPDTFTNGAIHVLWRAPRSAMGAFTSGIEWGSNVQLLAPWWTVGNGPYFRTALGEQTQSWGLYEDGGFRQHHINWNSGSATLYEMGSRISLTETHASPTFAWFYVGGGSWTGSHAEFYEVIIYSDSTTPQSTYNVSKNNYPEMFTYADGIYLQVGDSISSGQTTGNDDEWTNVAHTALGTTNWFTKGHGGGTLDDANGYIDDINWYVDNSNLAITGLKTITIFMGTNDMATAGDNVSGETAYSRLETLLAGLSSNWDRIILMTALDRTSANFDARRAVFNASVIANTTATAVVRLDQHINLVDSTNATYFAGDGVHPNDAGAIAIGQMFERTINILNGDTMGILFSLRADDPDMEPRFVTGVTATVPWVIGSDTLPSRVADAAGIGGYLIDVDKQTSAYRSVRYIGYGNVPDFTTGISINARIVPRYTGAPGNNNLGGIWILSGPGNQPYMTLQHKVTTGYINILATDATLAATMINVTSSSGWSPTAGTAYDITFTWDGTTTANAVKIYVDGVLLVQGTASLATNFAAAKGGLHSEIKIANASISGLDGDFDFDELTIWSEVIDPTSVTLTSGAGSLAGAARTAYVDVTASDALPSSGGGSGGVGLGYPGLKA